MDSLIAYRIADARHALMDGYGALMFGGRWNSPGFEVIYASLSYSCAMLEVLAHIGRQGIIPKNHRYIKISIPQSLKIESFAKQNKHWNSPDTIASRAYGDQWIKEIRTVALIVPSVVATEDKNIVINPKHPDYRKIKASPPQDIIWNERLFT